MAGNWKVFCGVLCGLMALNSQAVRADAAEALPVATDVNQSPNEIFGVRAAAPFGAYTVNSDATLNGNAVFGITQLAIPPSCCHGEAIVAAISNGENGDGGPTGTDMPNMTPANSVFTTIGNPTGRLEDGNVIRLSAWFRSDPANPITAEPQVAPLLKMEYWTEGLSGIADTSGVKVAPASGDRIFDQDQQGYAIGITDPPAYVDINNDGTVVHEAGITPASGRLFGLATDHWTLASVTHTVNSDDWFGIGPTSYGQFDITKIEAVKGIIFTGHFDTMSGVAGPGTLLMDNMLMEVFRNAASVTPLNNPNPTLSEVTGLPGDFNNNQNVDAADYTVWRTNLGAAEGSTLNGNGNNDAIINGSDYDLWKLHFGEHSPGAGGIGGSSAVPEPDTLLLAVITLLGSLTLQRPNRSTR